MMAFACICYHRDYLRDAMDIECRFQASPFFRDIPQVFIDCAKVAYPWNSTEYTPKVTGVPPHVLLMAKMEELMIRFKELRTDIKGDFDSSLDSRGIGGSEFHTTQILEAIKASTLAMNMAVQTRPSSSALVPFDTNESSSLTIIDEEESIVSSLSFDSDLETEDTSEEISAILGRRRRTKNKEVVSRRNLTMGFHHGRLQVLPPTWTFPKMSAKQLIDNWYVGNKEDHIPPLALLSPKDVAHLGTTKCPNQGKVKLRQMKAVMMVIERYARIEGLEKVGKAGWNCEYTKHLWEKLGNKYINAQFGKTNRNLSMAWKTLYNKMDKAKVFKDIHTAIETV